MDEPTVYLTTREAANLIMVSEGTIRKWEEKGKITGYRNVKNGFRMYEREEVLKLRKINLNKKLEKLKSEY